MKRFLFLFLVSLVLVLIIGCATIPTVETYPREEIKSFIGEYLRKHGDPAITMYGKNYENGAEYVELHWHINGKCYQVKIMQVDGEWIVIFDSFEAAKGKRI